MWNVYKVYKGRMCLFFAVSPFLMGLSNAYSFSHPFIVHILAKVKEMQVETKHGSYDLGCAHNKKHRSILKCQQRFTRQKCWFAQELKRGKIA